MGKDLGYFGPLSLLPQAAMLKKLGSMLMAIALDHPLCQLNHRQHRRYELADPGASSTAGQSLPFPLALFVAAPSLVSWCLHFSSLLILLTPPVSWCLLFSFLPILSPASQSPSLFSWSSLPFFVLPILSPSLVSWYFLHISSLLILFPPPVS